MKPIRAFLLVVLVGLIVLFFVIRKKQQSQ